MSLNTTSEGMFNIKNPEEVVRFIQTWRLAISWKHYFERKKLAIVFGNEQMNEVKAKLDIIHQLLDK